MAKINSNKVERTYKRWKFIFGDLVCFYCKKICKRNLPENHPEKSTIDHVLPIAKGGNNNSYNLAICCNKCNQNKKSYIELKYIDKLRDIILNNELAYKEYNKKLYNEQKTT